MTAHAVPIIVGLVALPDTATCLASTTDVVRRETLRTGVAPAVRVVAHTAGETRLVVADVP